MLPGLGGRADLFQAADFLHCSQPLNNYICEQRNQHGMIELSNPEENQ